MVPARRVELHTFERFASGDRRNAGIVEQPDRRDQDRRRKALPAGRLNGPAPGRRIESRAQNFGVEAYVLADAVPLDAQFDVAEDLIARGERGRPAVILIIRERIQARNHVTGGPRIAVVAPYPADVRGALQDRERIEPGLLERDRKCDAAEPAADDEDRGRDDGPRLSAWRLLRSDVEIHRLFPPSGSCRKPRERLVVSAAHRQITSLFHPSAPLSCTRNSR